MRNKKWSARMTAVMTAAVLTMSVAACSSAQDGEAGTADAAGTEQAAASTEAITETGEASDTDTAATDEAAEDGQTSDAQDNADAGEENTQDMAAGLLKTEENPSLAVSISDHEVEGADQDEKTAVATKIQYLQVDEDGYEALQKSLDEDNEENLELAKEGWENAADYLKEQAKNEDLQTPYEIDSTILLKRADEKVVSYLRDSFSQLGGAHPSTYYTGKNYNTKTGELLSLRDIAADYDALYQYVCEELASRAAKDPNVYFEGYTDTVHDMFYGADVEGNDESAVSGETGLYSEMPEMIQWYLDGDGLTVVFNDYDIAPYAAGPSTVTIPYDSGLLNTDWEA